MYNDPYYSNNGELEVLIAALGIFVFFAIAISLVYYLFFAFGLKRMADRENLDKSWLAFIPIAQIYLMGKLVEDRVNIPNLPAWLLWGGLGTFLLIWVPFLNMIVSLAYMVLVIITYHKLFEKYSENAVLFTVLGLLLSIQPFFIFAIRNNPIRPVVTVPPTLE